MTAPIPTFEEARLATLRSLKLLDTLPEAEFDDIVEAACVVMDVPIALITAVDHDRQWFKAKRGTDVCETSRDIAFCAHAIMQKEPLVIEDATEDPRFARNPLVTGELHLRFYAGVPIFVEGMPVGTLCCIDMQAHQPSERQLSALSALSRQVAALLHARLRAETFAESERRFVAFLDNAPTIASLKDAEGRMQFVNRRFASICDPSRALGKQSHEWLDPEIAQDLMRHDAEVLRAGRPLEFEEHVPLSDGTPRVWQSYKFPVEVQGETWIGNVSVDVTGLKEARENVRRQAVELAERNIELEAHDQELSKALERAESATASAQSAALRFEQLFAGLPVACFTYDADGTIHEWNGAAEQLWGIDSSQAFLASIYGTAVGDANHEAQAEIAQRVFAGESSLGDERLEILGDGSERWILTNTFPIWSSNGSVLGAVSANLDVTERRTAEAQLREKEERFRTVVESLHEGLIVQNEIEGVILWNGSAERVLGITGEQLAGRNSLDPRWRAVRQDGSDMPGIEHPSVRALQTGQAQEATTMGIHLPTGELRWLTVNAAPMLAENGSKPRSVVASFLDVTERIEQERQIREYSLELEEANGRLEALATTDGLTGLYNHRYFQDFLRRKIDHCRDAGLPLSIALLDVDRFKSYNDDFGHQAGDTVLQGVARALENGIRPGDLAARYGGEEFVIVMPGTDEAGACALADRVRCLLEKVPFDQRRVTASFGVSTFGLDLTEAQSLIRAADEALYRSKSAGRNRVTHCREMAADDPRRSMAA